ncbi:hypothetical protein GCM10011504_59210 [Siccirubricoccus deserti]|nr:hypothetical protein GCM10011504_59210 [Siccirubricoccus deserti]
MAAAERRMVLTPDLVARAARAVPDSGPLPASAYLAELLAGPSGMFVGDGAAEH